VSQTVRLGIQIGPGDPFWVQVRERIWQRAQSRSIELVELGHQETGPLSPAEQIEVVEDVLAQELDGLILNTFSIELLRNLLDRRIPIVYVSEIELRHPRLVSRYGLYDAAHMVGAFLHERLAAGQVLVVGGLPGGEHQARNEFDSEDNGHSRLGGFVAALPADGRYTIHHVPSEWPYEAARAHVTKYLTEHADLQPDAIFGLSDPLALAARDACQALGRTTRRPLVLGINGDPLALAAVVSGQMTATVETDVDDIAAQAIDLACRAACGEALPPFFQHKQRLVTADNIAEVATAKLISLADLPTRLVGINRRADQRRVVQLETSLEINRRVGALLDRERLACEMVELIRANYGYDVVQLLGWDARAGVLTLEQSSLGPAAGQVLDDPGMLLLEAIEQQQLIFIPDVRRSRRYLPDRRWPETLARTVLPVRLGDDVIGLLDLHDRRPAQHTRQDIFGLQLLADQLAIALRNAELYGQALDARALAEKADRLKTMLLANVTHELRTPLNVILGYSRTALDTLPTELPLDASGLTQDLRQIYRSGEHLLRLINDLLDLSRSEIDELDLLPESIHTPEFLNDVFEISIANFGQNSAVEWQRALPPDLPLIRADPVRLRQVLLNLLHNAYKFTQHGRITLGAEVAGAELHLWVADTGAGIPDELQQQIFDPFISVGDGVRRREGIGLGLSIARRLVGLHRGRLLVESRLGRGSTFHIYLPLPVEAATSAPEDSQPQTLLLVSNAERPAAHVAELAERRGLALRLVRANDDLADVLAARPALLAWDLATAAASGWSVVEQIRAHPLGGRLPIMLFHGESGVVVDQPAPPTGLLLKPLGDDALIEALRDLDPQASNGSILIVEDDPEIRALHRRILASHFPGYTIRDAGNGRVAIELMHHETPSLVVLDLVMPDVDGFGVLEAMRADPRTATVSVLVLSGRTLDADDIRRLGEARVIFQTKGMLSEGELAEALGRTLARDDLLPPHTSALVKQAIAFIQQHHHEPVARQEIAAAVGVSKDYLGRIFHQELGLSPWEYLIRYRVLRAKELLQTTTFTVAEVAARVGFDSATYFSHIFHREVGCSPRDFRAQAPR
jgi:signal transduction histidine kinase/AraC-like DNA-binding protein/ABC-type sugar transport system substrate-binding protein